jgi:glycosyltransferase involved in cell wall biosynthesis
LFEYMAAGLPVIASNFPLWKEIVTGIGCGVLVDPLKPTEIADAIEYLLTHPAEAEQMGIRGREAVERKFNWECEQHKLLQFYESLLAGREKHFRALRKGGASAPPESAPQQSQ